LKINRNKLYAVLTGDVIGSARLSTPHRKKLFDLLRRSSTSVMNAYPGDIPLPVDVFRGDSWQLIVADPVKAPAVALYVRAVLREGWGSGKIDSRIAIGIGTIDFIPGDRASEGDGEAFRRSGGALEGMKKSYHMRFSVHDKQLEETLNIIFQLIDVLASRWTGKQARAIRGVLQGFTQEKIASLWRPKIKQQTVYKHLERAGWWGIEPALASMEKSLKKLF
jgi:hypothetical protein